MTSANLHIQVKADELLSALRGLIAEAREVKRELAEVTKDARSVRKDVVALMEAWNEAAEMERPAIKAQITELVEQEMKRLGDNITEASDAVTEKINKKFDVLTALLDEPRGPDGETLEDTLRRRGALRALSGDPVTAAAEPLRKGEIVAVQGREYELGQDVYKIGTFLYENKRDGKLYPGPGV